MKKSLLLVILLLASLLFLGCRCTPTQSLRVQPTIQPDILPSQNVPGITQLIEYNVIIWQPSRPVCGGTVVYSTPEKTQVLTASHCVLDEDEQPIPYGFIQFNGGGKYRVEVKTFDREQDLALVETTDKMPQKLVAPIALLPPGAGDPVWIIGFGAAQPDILSHGTIAIADTHSIHTPDTHCMLIDGSAYYGNSGGGVFNSSFQLIGVLIQIGPNFPAAGLWSYAVHLDELQRFLDPVLGK